MVKTIWAVACLSLGIATIPILYSGCAVTKETLAPAQDRPAESAGASQPGQKDAVTAQSAAPRGDVAVNAHKETALPGQVYKLGAEDVLHISVWDNRELTLDVTVRPDGKISVPLIRDVQAAGLTANELADVIHKRLLAYIKDPQVSVVVTQINAPRIYVIGNVVRPGPYPLRSDMSVLQALALAGGFTPFASPRSIKIVRGSGERQEVRKINYYEIIEDSGKGNYLMKAGDTLVVP